VSYFAYVPVIADGKGIVENVISADVGFIEKDAPFDWILTSYNTHSGVHYGPDGKPDGGVALRGNYAGIGDIYDSVNNVFYAPQPYPSWTISAPTWQWQPPVPYPSTGGPYVWDEATLSWVEI
jgi:hypothetical protein